MERNRERRGRNHRRKIKKQNDQQMDEEKKKMDEEKKKTDDVFKILIKSKAFLKTLSSKSEIGRCRCVCKVWRWLLSIPEFEREHLRNNQVTIDDYKLVVFDGKQPFSRNPFFTLSFDATLPPHFECERNKCFPDVFIKASLDGLICVAVSAGGVTSLVLTSPLTGVSKRLSCIPVPNFKAKRDPVGFYVDPVTNDYKLVCVPLFAEGALVYTYSLHDWKEIEFPVSSRFELFDWSYPTFYRQCLYFEVSRYMYSVIICFDVKTETFKEMPLPTCSKATRKTRYSYAGLVVLKGCLHLYVSYNISKRNHGVDVWRMKDDDGWEWVEFISVGRDKEKHILICSTDNSLAVLDMDDNSFRKMSTEDFKTCYRSFCSKFMKGDRLIYLQTLVEPW